MISVESVNKAFPRYPMTVNDKGWIYGVWYCGTSWQKVALYGQYPPGFLKRALALFPDARDILHCPSGTVTGPGITVDSISDGIRCPQIIASADALPFPDNSFDLILSDPPYSAEDSAKYGCDPFPLGKFIKEAHRILRPGGHLGMLHVYYPSYRRKEWKLDALIMVITGFLRRARVFSILTKQGEIKNV
jgi:SAM-dependent methyltransferase